MPTRATSWFYETCVTCLDECFWILELLSATCDLRERRRVRRWLVAQTLRVVSGGFLARKLRFSQQVIARPDAKRPIQSHRLNCAACAAQGPEDAHEEW